MKPVKIPPTNKEVHTYIQINTSCNQKCIFCVRPPEITDKQVFKFENIKKRIKEISKNPNAKRIIFTGGEPLLYPQLPGLIRYAKKYGFITEIQTNGTLLHTKISELKKSGLDVINFAFNSHKKDISNKLQRTKSGFERIIKNLKLKILPVRASQSLVLQTEHKLLRNLPVTWQWSGKKQMILYVG